MDREEVGEHLIKWLNSLPDLSNHVDRAEDLSDGSIIAQALHEIAPEWFDVDWLSKIRSGYTNDPKLKLANLKRILSNLVCYYSEVLEQDLPGFLIPDLTLIVERNCLIELGRLLQLLLGCAINCMNKEAYIQYIMMLEESVQHTVMNAIQELLQLKESSVTDGPDKEENRQRKSFLSALSPEKDDLIDRIHQLENQVCLLKEEKNSLLSENEALKENQGHPDVGSTFSSNTDLKRVESLQKQVEKLKDENYALESARDELRLKSEAQIKEIAGLESQVEELASLAEQSQALKDEVDELGNLRDKLKKYELTIETYRKKLDDMTDVKTHVRSLEENNTQLLQLNVRLEEELKKSVSLKIQAESYREQLVEAQTKLSELARRFEKAELESSRTREKWRVLEAENQRLRDENIRLSTTIDEMRLGQFGQVSVGGAIVFDLLPPETISELGLDRNTPAQEVLIRLIHEHKQQQCRSSEVPEQLRLLQEQLESAQAQRDLLEAENRNLHRRISSLEVQVQAALVQAQETPLLQSSISSHVEPRQEPNNLNCEPGAGLEERRSQIEPVRDSSSPSEDAVILNEILAKKDQELRASEERYRQLLVQTQSIVANLDSTEQAENPEVIILRNQIREKEMAMVSTEKELDRLKTAQMREEKLIMSAWYELAMGMHGSSMEERLMVGGNYASFLAKQRQLCLRRNITPMNPDSKSSPDKSASRDITAWC